MLFSITLISAPPAKVLVDPPENAVFIENALAESFVIHLRNLINSLYLQPSQRSVVASDFCKPRTWPKVRPPKSRLSSACEDRANKKLAHLTIDRSVGNEWSTGDVVGEIRPVLQLFVHSARHGVLSPRVANVIR
jgi:hypothetical protein